MVVVGQRLQSYCYGCSGTKVAEGLMFQGCIGCILSIVTMVAVTRMVEIFAVDATM